MNTVPQHSPDSVVYRDQDHTYWGPEGRRYLSASQIVDKFKPAFDREGISESYALRAGHDATYWQEQWNEKRDKSLSRGNHIHDLREQIILSRGMDMHNGRPLPVPNPDLYPVHTPWKQMPDGIYPEAKLWNHTWQIAGRTDKLVIRTESDGRYADIDDYKTGELIRFQSYCNKQGEYNMLLPPVSHLMNCEAMIYRLQTSLYMFMAECQGFKPGRITLIHFPHIPMMAPPGAKEPPPVSYSLPYDKRSVLLMLNHLKTHGKKEDLQRSAQG